MFWEGDGGHKSGYCPPNTPASGNTPLEMLAPSWLERGVESPPNNRWLFIVTWEFPWRLVDPEVLLMFPQRLGACGSYHWELSTFTAV